MPSRATLMRTGPCTTAVRRSTHSHNELKPSTSRSALETGCKRREHKWTTHHRLSVVLVHASKGPAPVSAAYRGPESFPTEPSTSSTPPPSSTKTGSKSSSKDANFQEDDISSHDPMADANEVLKLVSLLPSSVRERLESDPRVSLLIEVVMDLGRPPLARFPGGDVRLSEAPVSEEDLSSAIKACGDFGGDNRAGIDGTLHRISAIRNRSGRIVGLTCRVGRSVQGSAAMIADLAAAGKSILLLGIPGVGKTTAIREISRLLADVSLRRVVIVDTSNEIGGDGDIPHPGVGRARRMQVPVPEQQHRVMIEAVENHMPEVIVIDEIGTEAEALAARTIAQRGVQLVATAHGNELENVMKNPSLNDLVGGICSVTLGDEEAKRRGVQKSVLERASPPTFDVTVEMVSREQWRVHLDVGGAVDSILLGRDAGAEVRERDAEGQVWAWPEDESTDTEDEEESSLLTGGKRESIIKSKQKNSTRDRRPKVETQPFPEVALAAARGETWVPSDTFGEDDPAAAAERKAIKKRSEKGNRAAGPTRETLQVFLYGIDPESVLSVADALNMTGNVVIATQIQDADAVLATRARLKSSGWIRGAAQAAGVPMFTVRSAGVEHVVKGVRALLGVDPSPGGLFANGGKDGLAAADPRVASSDVLRAETSIALVNQQQQQQQQGEKSGRVTSAATAKDALAEALGAIQSIVLPHGQPAELKPRGDDVIEKQVALAREHGLTCEVAGSIEGQRRLRVLPQGWSPGSKGPVNLQGMKGGKDYW